MNSVSDIDDIAMKNGKCLIFAWGPPWNWFPSFQRSERIPGWSITWLWFGLHFLPRSVASVIVYSESWRAQNDDTERCEFCSKEVNEHNSIVGGNEDEYYRICWECIND